MPDRPLNILFVFSDQQHRWTLGCMGHPEARTPNLDALAAGGVLFRRCYTNDPVCGPFRGSLLTGQHTSRCGVRHNGDPLPPGRRTLAEAFNAGGSRTSYVGKWHLGGAGNGPIDPALRGGFTDFIGYQCYNGFYRDVCFYDEDGREHRFDRHRTDVTTDLALERLRRLAGRPFLMMVSYQAPHYPVQPPPEFEQLYRGVRITRRANAGEIDPFTPTASPRSPRPFDLDPDYRRYGGDLDEYLRLYYAMCSHIDAGVGRLLDGLDRLGLAESTAVVYTSDHGDMQGSHGLKNKSLPHEESAGIPLVTRAPGGSSGRVCDALVSGVDFMPTCLDLAGLPAVEGLDGRSFAPTLRGGGDPPERAVFAERPRWCMICRDRWKLVADRTDEGLRPTMLFDLAADPCELTDLIDDPASAPVRAALLAELTDWDRRVAADRPAVG